MIQAAKCEQSSPVLTASCSLTKYRPAGAAALPRPVRQLQLAVKLLGSLNQRRRLVRFPCPGGAPSRALHDNRPGRRSPGPHSQFNLVVIDTAGRRDSAPAPLYGKTDSQYSSPPSE